MAAIQFRRAPGSDAILGPAIGHFDPQEGLGFVSKSLHDLFRPLVGDLADKEPLELKPPYRLQRAAPEQFEKGSHYPYGVLFIKARLAADKFPLEAVVKGEWMKWAIAEALSETFSKLCKTRVPPRNVLFCADEVEVLDTKMPYLGDSLWQFCDFRFDYRVATRNEEESAKIVYYVFNQLDEVEAEFCKNLENKYRNIYHITILGLFNKENILMEGQRLSDELALFEAAQKNDLDGISTLLQRVDVNSACAEATGFPKYLLEEEQRFLFLELGRTPLLAAAEEGHVDATKLLLDAQADVNFQDSSGFHALYLAAGSENSRDLVPLLLASSADVNLANKAGYTPLHNACGSGEVPALQALLDAGADWNAKSGAGAAPVHVAVINDQPDILKVLKDRGANLDMPALGGNTPVHEGVMQNNPSIIKHLRELGANINIQSGPDNHCATPLRMAIDRKKKKAAKYLVEVGALEAIKDEDSSDEDDGPQLPNGR
mmetsp:Transcript_470/g.1099  ORF Transcript_470/g.1099 Transcript_470/m.1099 type:complete len:488 (-) Transcript_470:106-1569(-)|eukprot:CAMPEP_0206581120 /NCGR_PEP_ID=MMETSP0325_2-20121206/33627_1 /ASSEMBLY_ACC=CAM_ASM_000347 /TAXON_ID=2866 /ORGANISM="Crypthecodinium cohnii, Strain Seligo" /LENGTH=487 /DNA_ID=CAMNT_0054087405 /DNA_START=55 /DNA_END=1518 /DNA_ORIENTATION=-